MKEKISKVHDNTQTNLFITHKITKHRFLVDTGPIYVVSQNKYWEIVIWARIFNSTLQTTV